MVVGVEDGCRSRRDDDGDVGDTDAALALMTFSPRPVLLHGRRPPGLHGCFGVPAERVVGGDGGGTVGPGVLRGTDLVAGYELQD